LHYNIQYAIKYYRDKDAYAREDIMTLEQAIEGQHCRTGKIDGTTKNGRFWLASVPITISDAGNGWDTRQEKYTLHLRHFECGTVEATVRHNTDDNRNNLRGKWDYEMPSLLACRTVEDVVVELKKGLKMEVLDEYHQEKILTEECYQDRFYEELMDTLLGLGMAGTRPGPDEGEKK
jgi:hypothetical protein